MISKNVQNMIPKIQDFFVGQPITKAWLFGSCSRGEETTDSDIDILVEYDRQHNRISLMKIAGMISKNVQNMIPKIQDFFVGQPITKAWLFGSCSRGEETTDSDIDILVEYDRQHNRISLMKIAGIMLKLEDLLHRKVDIVEANRLLPFAQETANQDKFLIYERKS